MKNLRNGDGPTVTNDDRALRRALEIERSMVRLYERKLRALLTEQGVANLRRICRQMAVARCSGGTPANLTGTGDVLI